jgi:hypothetical protein
MGFLGMDVDDVQRRAVHLNALVSELVNIQVGLETIFSDGTTWVGPEADSARERLHDEIIPALKAVRAFVEDTASVMSINAKQQLDASSAQ